MTYIFSLQRLDHYVHHLHVCHRLIMLLWKYTRKLNEKLFKFNYLTLLARLSRNLTAVCWSVLCMIYITLDKTKKKKLTSLNQRFFQRGGEGAMTSRWEIIVGCIDPTLKQTGKYLRPVFKDKGRRTCTLVPDTLACLRDSVPPLTYPLSEREKNLR